ncbi:hypothetical protein [Alkalibaculum bacchi]|uniref:hypothetical protein n=1 Tax=Alkalibaculum bacchi TaxID=645887 RepID=UPI0026ECC03E|nr:hypothetical protein [Alkalibaculum bacchi]
MKKVLVTPRSFAKYNRQEILALFQSNSIEPIFNAYNAIMNEEQLIEALKDVDGLIDRSRSYYGKGYKQCAQFKSYCKIWCWY